MIESLHRQRDGPQLNKRYLIRSTSHVGPQGRTGEEEGEAPGDPGGKGATSEGERTERGRRSCIEETKSR
ncbi:hypothetical protein GE061_018865 [Apolygus lucorum]|uniref:Uncharacterized protein n=1 Tax=Apolygus lucorum TaxID=248454 RepID=A0A8S9X891_APOLU|nr:hypothetical protein GE061_018865 [Apolygus lucorum]